ncbi:MAG: DUF262 domain-containing protein [Candidatus Lokiarchaeota archaeon]|nr:DUF262 domain-containing protein [Candidatus Lokiarchaeota archaeon]
MDPRAQFYNQIELFENNFDLERWNIKKDGKNNIIIVIPKEWVLHSQYNGVSLQSSINTKGELALSVSVENPIPLQYRADFKKDLLTIIKSNISYDFQSNGFEINTESRGKLIKKRIPMLSDSYKQIMEFINLFKDIIPHVQSLLKKYNAENKIFLPDSNNKKTMKLIESEIYQQSESPDVIFDEDDSGYTINYTPERKIFTQKSEYSVEYLLRQSRRGKLNLQPDFQRQFVWDKVKASGLIESLLLDVPIPIIYLAEDDDGTLLVIDGQQRLSSIFSFIDGRFPNGKFFRLSKIKILKEINQKLFSEIDESYQDKLEEAPLSTIIVKKESDPELKFEIFERLNTGSVKLNDQELRNCLFRGPYIDLLKQLSNDKDYQYIMGFKGPDKRMKDVEYVLRFSSFFHQSYFKCTNGLSNFLNNDMKNYQNINEEDQEELITNFKKAVQINKSLFGNRSFRKIRRGDDNDPNSTWKNTAVVNGSLYDVMMTCFIQYDRNIIYRNLEAIREAVIHLMTENQDFIDSIEKWTGQFDRVKKRFEIFLQTIRSILDDGKEDRLFSYDLKEKLFKQNNKCAICGQMIYMIEDAAIDHIEQYWLGGRTIPENARLTHRYCNSVRKRKE